MSYQSEQEKLAKLEEDKKAENNEQLHALKTLLASSQSVNRVGTGHPPAHSKRMDAHHKMVNDKLKELGVDTESVATKSESD